MSRKPAKTASKAPKRPEPAPADPRAEALALLEAVLEEGRSLDAALAASRALPRMAARDRAFARLLVTTLLRRLGQIDAALKACLDRPLKRRDTRLRNLLRLGAVQILFLGTPPHAAVNTTLELATGDRLAGLKGLLNAVLRRLTRDGAALLEAQDAARLDTPAWLWNSWCAAYGETAVRAMAAIHASEPPLDLTAKADPERWAEILGAALLPGGALRLPSGQGDVAALPGYDEGAWWVQDVAAALPARLLGPVAGLRVFDLCAAPGGKTAQLAAAGAKAVAVDASADRMKRLGRNLERLGLAAETVVADLFDWAPEAPADAVLLDGPCSATGTLRRHPDIAWLKAPEQVAMLAEIQDRMLRKSVELLKPGGLLVFATCSLQPEEGPQRIAALLRDIPGLARVPVQAAEIAGLAEAITPEGDLRTLPHFLAAQGGMDGFYACRLHKG